MVDRRLRTEAPTLLVLAGGAYGLWAVATVWISPLWLAIIVAGGFAAALHSSLTHEMLHGHPTRNPPWINGALVFPALSLAIPPYMRFRDTHLAHHDDERLTDPYDDPETNFMDPAVWARLSLPCRVLMRVNNTLAGRMVLGGPIIGRCCSCAAICGPSCRGGTGGSWRAGFCIFRRLLW